MGMPIYSSPNPITLEGTCSCLHWLVLCFKSFLPSLSLRHTCRLFIEEGLQLKSQL